MWPVIERCFVKQFAVEKFPPPLRREFLARSIPSHIAQPDRHRIQAPLLEDLDDFAFTPGFGLRSIRSCDSDSMISYGVMPVSR